MLPVIDDGKPFKLLAIDPGSSNLGFAILEYDFIKESISTSIVETINLKTNDLNYKHLLDYHDDKVVRLRMLQDHLDVLLNEHRPHAVIAESNYMGKFANGFAALVECVLIIRNSVYNYDPFLKLNMIDPTTVKTNIGMKRIRGTTKDDVKEHLIKSKKVKWNGVDPNTLDEHSIDAVAIGVWYMDNVL